MKVVAAIFFGFLLAAIAPMTAMMTKTFQPSDWLLYVPRSFLFAAILYFGWLVVHETTILVGELEQKLVPRWRFGVRHALHLMVSPWVTLAILIPTLLVVAWVDFSFVISSGTDPLVRVALGSARVGAVLVGTLAAQAFMGVAWV